MSFIQSDPSGITELLFFITDIRRYEEAAEVTVSDNIHLTHLQRGKEFKNVCLCQRASITGSPVL